MGDEMEFYASERVKRAVRLTVSLLLLGLLVPMAGHAEGLMEVYLQAQQNDPLLKGAYYQQLSVKEGQRQALAKLLPTLTAFGEYTDTSQDIVSSDNDVYGSGSSDYDTTAYGLTLTQPLFRWDSIAGYQKSKVESLQAEAEYLVAQQDLITRVAALYLDALSSRDQLHYVETEMAAVEKHYELASGRHQMGLIPVTDLHDAKARLAAIQAKAIEAQNQLDDAFQALSEVTGTTITNLNDLQAAIPLVSPQPADVATWIESGLDQNPAIILHQHAVEAARKEISRQRGGHYPTLDLVGSYSDEETDGSLFGGGSEVEDMDIALKLNLPLYQGGEISSRVRQAQHELSYSEQELTRQQRTVTRQVRSAYLGVQTSLSRVEALRQSIVSNQLALEAKQEGFMSGLYTSLNVLDAERDLSMVSIDYSRARYDYILNSLKLRQAVGTLADSDLAEIDLWFIQ